MRAPLAALLVAAWATVAGAEAPGPPPVVRYVTLNVLHGGVLSGLTGEDQRFEARLALVAEELRALDADVFGLQEASIARGRGDVAARLAGALGFHHVHAPALHRLTPVGWLNRGIAALLPLTEGPAILSRWPITATETLDLPACGRFWEPRVLLFAEVETPWGRLPVFSTHTAGNPCHTARVAALVRERRRPLPALLMGDFNAAEGSDAVAELTGGGLVDVFRAANPEAPGLTVWQRIEIPEPTVRRRVDYLLLLPGCEVPGRVLGSRVVLDAPRRLPDGSLLWPSDHYGVLGEVAVFGPAAGVPVAGAC